MFQLSKELFYIFIIILIFSCSIIKHERVNQLTKYKDNFFWNNTVDSLDLSFYTDSAYASPQEHRKFRYEAVLVIDQRDSLYIHGFSKGNLYPSWINKKSNNTTKHYLMQWGENEVFFIRPSNENADTLFFKNKRFIDSLSTWSDFYLLKKNK